MSIEEELAKAWVFHCIELPTRFAILAIEQTAIEAKASAEAARVTAEEMDRQYRAQVALWDDSTVKRILKDLP
jgi:hypothetical protein